MLYKIGRLLQFAGLAILPVAIAGNLARPDQVTLGMSLGISAAGMLLFGIGWMLQQSARSQ